jgi:hypothetical protein
VLTKSIRRLPDARAIDRQEPHWFAIWPPQKLPS